MNIREQKNAERISYTMAPGGENHRDNQFIGVEPVPGTGLTAKDVKSIADVYAKKGYKVEYIDLNDVSRIEDTDEYTAYTKNGGEVIQASVCIIRNFVDIETTDQIYEDSIVDEWDAKYFDPKQYESVRNSNGKARRWKIQKLVNQRPSKLIGF